MLRLGVSQVFFLNLENISFFKENAKHRGHRDPQRTQRSVYSSLLCSLCPRKRLRVFVVHKFYIFHLQNLYALGLERKLGLRQALAFLQIFR